MREEVDFDPTKTEELNVKLCINDKKNNDNEPTWVFDGTIPWIIEEIENKIEVDLGKENLTSLHIESLNCKSYVANEFLEDLCNYNQPEQGLERLILNNLHQLSEPF